METPLSGAASGIAEVVIKKWFAAMGFVGLLLFATTFVVDISADLTTTRCIALMMFGWGFGQTECRTFRQRYSHRIIITEPEWRITVSGAILFIIAIGAAVQLGRHLLA